MNPKLFDYKSEKRTMYSDTFELADMVALWHILYSLANFNILLNFVVKLDCRDFRVPNTGGDVYNSTVMKWILRRKKNRTRYRFRYFKLVRGCRAIVYVLKPDGT